MPFEVACGQCGGRLLVERAGVIVACPNCEAHLSIPAAEEAGSTLIAASTDVPATLIAPSASPFLTAGEAHDAPTMVVSRSATTEPATSADFLAGADPAGESPTVISAPGTSRPAADPATIGLGEEPSDGPTEWISNSRPQLDDFVSLSESTDPIEDLFDQAEELPDFSAADPNEATQSLSVDSFSEQPTQLGESVDLATADPGTSATEVLARAPFPEPATERMTAFPPVALPPTAPPPSASSAPAPSPVRADTVPRFWFILVTGYASAVTLTLLLLLSGVLGGRPHPLESLPDLVPPTDSSGQIGMKKVPPDLNVAPGHVLALGQTQRFGDVRVTPLKVTRAPIQFERLYAPAPHAKQQKPSARAPSEPVLKLTLRFENVSTDRSFAPLDSTLVFKRIFERDAGRVFALNFLGSEQARRTGGDLFYHYDLPEFSEYLLACQDLNHVLKPGDVWETYLPSEEHLAQVEGEWVWRVLFRKGYHPESKRGVTTLIDVRFAASDVVDES